MNNEPSTETSIREAFRYAEQFRGTIFVFSVSSGLLQHHGLPSLIADIALLRRAGVRVAVVAGARQLVQTDAGAHAAASSTDRISEHDGVIVVPPSALVAARSAAFAAATQLLSLLTEEKVRAVIGNWTSGVAIGVRDGFDYGCSGRPRQIDTATVQQLLTQDTIPIFPSLGWSTAGRALLSVGA